MKKSEKITGILGESILSVCGILHKCLKVTAVIAAGFVLFFSVRAYFKNDVEDNYTTESALTSHAISSTKFDGVFISEELECQKPSIEYFTKVLNAIGNPDKKDCLVLGDSISGDILGGKNIGIDTVWVNVRDLKNYTDIKPDYTVTSLKELKEML
jgi:hypothetical protein